MTDNFPIEAIFAIHDILQVGAKKHAPANWRKEPSVKHLIKAHGHIHDIIDGINDDENHLERALCRLAMAVAVKRSEK